MIRRIRIIYDEKAGTIKGSRLTVRDWVRYKVNEDIQNLEYKDDFSTIFWRNREKGIYIIYAHTHRDAQKAMRKFFNNPLIPETRYDQEQA